MGSVTATGARVPGLEWMHGVGAGEALLVVLIVTGAGLLLWVSFAPESMFDDPPAEVVDSEHPTCPACRHEAAPRRPAPGWLRSIRQRLRLKPRCSFSDGGMNPSGYPEWCSCTHPIHAR